MRCGLALLSALLVAMAVAAAGSAEPAQIGAKRAEAQQVLAQIEQIDMQLDRAVDAWNGANVRLDRIERDLAINQKRLQLARKNLARAVTTREELNEQIRVTLLHEIGHLRGEDDSELAARGLE